MLEIWTFIGVKMAVMHFVTQFTHVSRHFGVFRKQKKIFRENCFENLFSDLKKYVLCVHTTTFRKNAKKNKN